GKLAGIPLGSWPSEVWDAFWSGEPDRGFPGLAGILEGCFERAHDESTRVSLAVYRELVPCPACEGSRLNPIARAVRLASRSIAKIGSLPVAQLVPIFQSLPVNPGLEKVVPPLAAEIVTRLECLVEVGVGYLTLDRGSDTLSGGELQRARLAAQL